MRSGKQIFLVLLPGFPESESDTTCLPFQQAFVRSLQEQHPELQVMVLALQYPYHHLRYLWYGIPVIPFGGRNRGGFHRLLLRGKVYAALRDLQKKNRIAGILSFWYGEGALIGKRFGRKYNIKHFCWICGQDARKNNPYPSRVKASGDQLIALSDSLQKEFMVNYGIEPLHVIAPGVKQIKQPIHERTIDIMGTGSLIPLKRYDVFIEVIAVLKKHLPSIRVVLAGDGPEKENLQLLAMKNGLGSDFTLTGELPHGDVRLLMSQAKVFLHTSSYEGFSMVCLEALSSGAKVISFVKPMNYSIENWIVVNSAEEMCDIALKILNEPAQQFSGMNDFSIKDSVKKIIQLYQPVG